MELAARQFARRVLIIHFALLCLVLLAVGLAAKFLYRSARTEVIQQAQITQELLARQTSLGIENYYQSVTGVLDLLQPPTPSTQPTSRPARQFQIGGRLNEAQHEVRMRNFEGGPFANMINRWGSIIWENSKEKVSLLIIVDVMDNMNVIKVIGTSDGAPNPDEVISKGSDWLKTVKTESISPFMPDLAGGAHLISVPVRAQGGVQMVAVVPMSNLENHLLQFVNRSETQRAALIDNRGTVISAANASARGKSLVGEKTDQRITDLGINVMKTGHGSTQTFERGEMIDGVPVRPAMITAEPVEIPGGKRWLVVISSGLDEVDNLVKPIFRDALVWAIVVLLAVMAILISTASQMIRSRLRLERAQMEIINKEMAQARQIQLNWLPDQPCKIGGLDIAALNTPASHVSGDFYNWFMLADGRIAVIIGDVTGHGMSGAFLMATTQLLVRTTLPRISDPGFCMEEVNRQLCTQVFSGQFVTMLILVFDLANNWLDICTAGHPPPILIENDQSTSLTLEPQLVLGVDETTEYRAQRFPLSPGASLLLYTDGVADAISPNGDRFTIDRIQKSITGPSPSAAKILDAVVQSIEKFRTGCDLSDDLTMVAMQTSPIASQVEHKLTAPNAV
ncbi:MAG TPA: SpoIIE family protein phosphatase [Tepidisphaeraceae bacterium]|jgi:serine phosphatase RsbU (regulator of sigma subunit)|nr:SpoIIE family protein phosphatase [Tepidisphaeraceae bacterium]